ncbi:MAG: hypothetical protein JXQ73_18815 [Phycisphaerae bacterium]|nr:hypothetical protein [Phycisphaerae bacterium]
MRVRCPYCEKPFGVFPIPTRQAIRHRRAGWVAWCVTVSVAAVVFAILGPRVVHDVVGALSSRLTPRLASGLCAGILSWPFVFLALAIYDRLVPHFGPPVQEHLRCIKCGHILEGLSEPRCPECGQPI